MKRCPACGVIFPATARYCDQDGETLVAVNRPRRPHRMGWGKFGIAIMALLLLACGAALPSLAKAYLRWKLDVTLEQAQLSSPAAPPAGAGGGSRPRGLLDEIRGWVEPLLTDPALALRLRVRNASSFAVLVESARYAVQVAGQEVARGVWTADPGPRSVAPGEDLPVDLTLRPKPELGWSSEMFREGYPAIAVNGDLTVEVLGVLFTVPFEVQRIRVGKAPRPQGKPSPAPAPEGDMEPGLRV